MNIPDDYRAGLERARAVNPTLAERYIEHTTIGDPLADALMDELDSIEPHQAFSFLQAGMDQDSDGLSGAPPQIQDFFRELETLPEWVDHNAFAPGVTMFHRNSSVILGGMIAGVLVEGFSTNISKSFFITGRLRDNGVRRLQQNNRHMIELFFPGGLARHGDGWKMSVRIRLVHARIRRLLNESDDWQADQWGTPLSAAHLGFAISAFSARLLKHMHSLGAKSTAEERASFMQIWRYSGHLMGIPDSILYESEADALELFRIGGLCEPSPDFESVVMAHALVNSGPLVAGYTDPEERDSLSKYIYVISRALIGNQLATELKYPPTTSSRLGARFALPIFRVTQRLDRLLQRIYPQHAQNSDFSKFNLLLDVGSYDDDRISYRLPDHVYAERSSDW